MTTTASPVDSSNGGNGKRHLRFHRPHLTSLFGDNWFALRAEAFARVFGTPTFLVAQTAVVTMWLVANGSGIVAFDLYPFILLNLAFSLQAAYAAPLILLAQTRQADRDKAVTEADALHREAISVALEERQILLAKQGEHIMELIDQNTRLTELTHQMSQRIQELTEDVRRTLQHRGHEA